MIEPNFYQIRYTSIWLFPKYLMLVYKKGNCTLSNPESETQAYKDVADDANDVAV